MPERGAVLTINEPAEIHQTEVDITIGSALTLILVLGLLGNISAFIYFWPRRLKTASDRLFVAIVVVDILTCLLTIPVTTSIFNNRELMLFNSPVFCGIWTVTTSFLFKLSIFLVTVLSVTRTVAMVSPDNEVKLSSILVTTTGYATLILTLDGAFFATGWIKGSYYKERILCDYAPTDHAQSERALRFLFFAFQLEVLLPPIVMFVSFFVSVISLSCSRTAARNNDEAEFRRTSVSLVIFTAVSLACNIPLIIFQIFRVLAYFDGAWEERTKTLITENYGYFLFRYLPYALNAALNPVVYLLRMRGFKDKVLHFYLGVDRRRRGRGGLRDLVRGTVGIL